MIVVLKFHLRIFFCIKERNKIFPGYSYSQRFSKHFLWQKFQMFLNFKNFSICFLRLILYIQILMYRNLDFLVKTATVACVLLVSAVMSFFRQKIIANIGRRKKYCNNTKASCSFDPVVSAAI